MKTRIKICGITRLEDALSAIDAGADALGFVFYPPSPRAITAQQAAEIIRQIPPFITTVGLFVDEQRETIQEILQITQLDLIQFHGHETSGFCESFSRPYIKAIRMRGGIGLKVMHEDYMSAAGLLLDTYQKGVPGGTGEVFNWDVIPPDLAKLCILAGGLNEKNIEQAVRQVQPYAVDVSGGVELKPGIKSAKEIQAFIRGVERANR